jgi:hypothetical protein
MIVNSRERPSKSIELPIQSEEDNVFKTQEMSSKINPVENKDY